LGINIGKIKYMRNKIFLLIGIFSILIFALLGASVDSSNGITIRNPLDATEFEVIIDNVVNFIFNIAVLLAPLMIIIAGFLFVTAGGNAEQISRARAIIIWTAVGFLIILLSRGIMGLIKTLLGVR